MPYPNKREHRDKHRIQETQLGKNLSLNGAYNGEEKVHVRKKRHICGELDARKIIIISFCKRSPQVL